MSRHVRHYRLLLFLVALAIGAAAQAAPPAAPGSVYGWMRTYAGRRARDIAQDPLFSSMLQLSVPPGGVFMGRASGFAGDLAMQMSHSSNRVELRDGRYLDFSGYRPDGGVSQSFFWVDLQADRAIGAMYVCLGPAGGCSQQLYVFAQQPDPVISLSQLPADFVAALAGWQKAARNGPPGCRLPNCHVPAVLTQYFFDSQGQNLLLHSAGNCSAGDAQALARCRSAEREASELDLAAAWQTTSGVAAGDQLLGAESAEGAWIGQRDQRCGAAGASPDCYSLANEQRAGTLLAGWLGRARERASVNRPALPPQAPIAAGSGVISFARAPALRVACRPVPVYQPDPRYTDAARRAGFQGSVSAMVMVAPDGHISNVALTTPVGYGMDQQIIQTLDQWRFSKRPASCPQVDMQLQIRLGFHLGGRLQ